MAQAAQGDPASRRLAVPGPGTVAEVASAGDVDARAVVQVDAHGQWLATPQTLVPDTAAATEMIITATRVPMRTDLLASTLFSFTYAMGTSRQTSSSLQSH